MEICHKHGDMSQAWEYITNIEKTRTEKIQMSEISQNIHGNNGIDHNFNMVLSILNIKNSINAKFSAGYLYGLTHQKISFYRKSNVFGLKTSSS